MNQQTKVVLFALLAFPALAQEAEDSAAKVAKQAYTTCTQNYLASRINWDATPGDLADAAAGHCDKERDAIYRMLIAKNFDGEKAMRVSDRVIYGYRLAMIEAILEMRNAPAQ